jgi:hypothetical protein
MPHRGFMSRLVASFQTQDDMAISKASGAEAIIVSIQHPDSSVSISQIARDISVPLHRDIAASVQPSCASRYYLKRKKRHEWDI